MPRQNDLISLRKRPINSGRKVVDYLDLTSVSIFIVKGTEELVVLKFRNMEYPGEVTWHSGG